MKQVKVEKVRHICSGYFKHKHHFKFNAIACAFVQDKINMNFWYFLWLRLFNQDKYNKIYLSMSGRNKRATQRRINRGASAI